MAREVVDLATALKRASNSAGTIRLVLFGRGSQEAEAALQSELGDAKVTTECLGLLSPPRITETLSSAQVLLFVRGQISTRRGSAIAGIACGLPVVCYSGPETTWPITEAGILTSPIGDCDGLASALETALSDAPFRKFLAERSRLAHERYFSWSAIAGQFVTTLSVPLNNQRKKCG